MEGWEKDTQEPNTSSRVWSLLFNELLTGTVLLAS